jgi:hypothetical protein
MAFTPSPRLFVHNILYSSDWQVMTRTKTRSRPCGHLMDLFSIIVRDELEAWPFFVMASRGAMQQQ